MAEQGAIIMADYSVPESTIHRITYMALRRSLGTIAILLPFVLIIGDSFVFLADQQDPGWRVLTSISAYYHTGMGDILVGSLCAIGIFLIAYSGHDWIDNRITDLAGLGALGVAMLPTQLTCGCDVQLILASSACPMKFEVPSLVNNLHFLSAETLLGSTAIISIFLFTKRREKQDNPNNTEFDETLQKRKARRNKLYVTCGILIVLSIIIILIDAQFLTPAEVTGQVSWLTQVSGIFLLESIAVIAFGIAWITASNITWHFRFYDWVTMALGQLFAT
jgi:hypothetical protein